MILVRKVAEKKQLMGDATTQPRHRMAVETWPCTRNKNTSGGSSDVSRVVVIHNTILRGSVEQVAGC